MQFYVFHLNWYINSFVLFHTCSWIDRKCDAELGLKSQVDKVTAEVGRMHNFIKEMREDIKVIKEFTVSNTTF